jgi:hypothetical protein
MKYVIEIVHKMMKLHFAPNPPVSFTNIDDRHDIAEILLNVAINTIKQTNKQTNKLPDVICYKIF